MWGWNAHAGLAEDQARVEDERKGNELMQW